MKPLGPIPAGYDAKDGQLAIDPADIVHRKSMVTQAGKVVWPDPTPLPTQDGAKRAVEQAVPDQAAIDRANYLDTRTSALYWGAGLSAYVGLACIDGARVFVHPTGQHGTGRPQAEGDHGGCQQIGALAEVVGSVQPDNCDAW